MSTHRGVGQHLAPCVIGWVVDLTRIEQVSIVATSNDDNPETQYETWSETDPNRSLTTAVAQAARREVI